MNDLASAISSAKAFESLGIFSILFLVIIAGGYYILTTARTQNKLLSGILQAIEGFKAETREDRVVRAQELENQKLRETHMNKQIERNQTEILALSREIKDAVFEMRSIYFRPHGMHNDKPYKPLNNDFMA